MENGLNSWQEENTRLTKESCHQLIALKQQHLDPVLTQLRGKDDAQVSFAHYEIMALSEDLKRKPRELKISAHKCFSSSIP